LRPAAATRNEEKQEMSEDSRKKLYETGLEIRREVLGREYVDNSLKGATDFNRTFQEMVTEYCWGAVWSRPEITRRERSMINLAMLTALGRTHEVELHVKGALNNGLTEKEISEVLLHTMIYCGVPAALDSFRAAKKAIAEHGK